MFMASAHAIDPIVEDLFQNCQSTFLRTHLGDICGVAGAGGSLHVDDLLLRTSSKERQEGGDDTMRPYKVGFKDPGEVCWTEVLHLVVWTVLLYGGVVDQDI